MILLNVNNPKYSIYYIAYEVMKVLLNTKEGMDMRKLYDEFNRATGIQFELFMLAMDWLYLNEKIEVRKDMKIVLCF